MRVPYMAILEDPPRSYDPGYAAGATLRRATDATGALHSDTTCEQGLSVRLESWAAYHFARLADVGSSYRHACREHFRRGFRDGYWGKACSGKAGPGFLPEHAAIHESTVRRRADALELVA